MDKMFLLTYTAVGYDGFPHSFHAWFETEKELKTFVANQNAGDGRMEVDLAIEIEGYRSLEL